MEEEGLEDSPGKASLRGHGELRLNGQRRQPMRSVTGNGCDWQNITTVNIAGAGVKSQLYHLTRFI